MIARVLVAGICLSLVMLLSAQAMAQTKRYALIMGNNYGEPEDVALKYASEDARRMAQVMLRLGGVPKEHLHLLIDAGATQAKLTIKQLNDQITRQRQAHPDEEILLLVYYSGHADRKSLHMGGTQLELGHLRGLLEGSQANLRVLIVDACQSGELTRVKGAKPAAPFKLEALEEPSSQGMAIITSATAGEYAQESERLGGSYFTHHLIAGLLGAADHSQDQQITLTEAYQYAYKETLRATSRLQQIQHPTYAFTIRGRRDLVLTRLNTRHQSYGHLALERAGRYVIFGKDVQGELIAEFSTTQPTQIILKAGQYLVRWRDQDRVHEATVSVEPKGQTTRLEAKDFKRIPYAQVVRKGPGDMTHDVAATSLALLTGGAYSGELLPATGAPWALMLGLQLDLSELSLQLKTRAGQARAQNAFLSMEQRFFGVELAALKVWDWRSVSAGVGAGVGVDWIQQRFETRGQAPSRAAPAYLFGPRLQLQYAALPWLSLMLSSSLDLSYAKQQREGQAAAFHDQLIPSVGLGLALTLF